VPSQQFRLQGNATQPCTVSRARLLLGEMAATPLTVLFADINRSHICHSRVHMYVGQAGAWSGEHIYDWHPLLGKSYRSRLSSLLLNQSTLALFLQSRILQKQAHRGSTVDRLQADEHAVCKRNVMCTAPSCSANYAKQAFQTSGPAPQRAARGSR
jgi:hypothetical protein